MSGAGRDPVTDLPAIEEDLVQRLAVALASEFFHSVLFHDGEVKAAPNTVAIARRLVAAVVRPLLEENERLRSEFAEAWASKCEELAGETRTVTELRGQVRMWTDLLGKRDGELADALLELRRRDEEEIEALRAGVGYRQVGTSCEHGMSAAPRCAVCEDTHQPVVPVYVKEEQE